MRFELRGWAVDTGEGVPFPVGEGQSVVVGGRKLPPYRHISGAAEAKDLGLIPYGDSGPGDKWGPYRLDGPITLKGVRFENHFIRDPAVSRWRKFFRRS